MTLNDFFFLAKKYCSDVQYVRCIGQRVVAYGGDASESLFAVDFNVENPALEILHFDGHINGGLLGELGIGVPDTYTKNFPLVGKIIFTDGSETIIPISSPSNFEQWVNTNCPKYAFSKKANLWWTGEYLGQTCTSFQGKRILNISLYRTINQI